MTAPGHDHDAEIERFGLCLTCADVGMVEQATQSDPARQLVFDGATFDAERDATRLGAQAVRVLALMADGRWHTLSDLAEATGDPEASISARLRDLRKPRFGSHQIERRRVGSPEQGWHEYRLRLHRG